MRRTHSSQPQLERGMESIKGSSFQALTYRISWGTGTAAPRSNRMRSISKLFLCAASISGVISGANMAVFMSTVCQLCGRRRFDQLEDSISIVGAITLLSGTALSVLLHMRYNCNFHASIASDDCLMKRARVCINMRQVMETPPAQRTTLFALPEEMATIVA